MKRLVATFYRSVTGAEPVRDWLLSLEPADRKVVGVALSRWKDYLARKRPAQT